jgi:hypothetical protein
LNSPIGATIAPDNFGQFSNDVLIGNFGDSHVNAFDPTTGKFLGQLTDSQGNPLVLNGGFKETNTEGLWGIGFGNGSGGAGTATLFFATGINMENDGLFGKVNVATATMAHTRGLADSDLAGDQPLGNRLAPAGHSHQIHVGVAPANRE